MVNLWVRKNTSTSTLRFSVMYSLHSVTEAMEINKNRYTMSGVDLQSLYLF